MTYPPARLRAGAARPGRPEHWGGPGSLVALWRAAPVPSRTGVMTAYLPPGATWFLTSW